MGLDIFIGEQKILNDKEEVLLKISGEKNEWKEVLYWRKDYKILNFVSDWLDKEVENCEEYELTRGFFLDLLDYIKNDLDYNEGGIKLFGKKYWKKDVSDKIKTIKEILEQDFNKVKFIFMAWW